MYHKLFESYPMVLAPVAKKTKRLKEFIVYSEKHRVFGLMNEGIEIDMKGNQEYWATISNTGFIDLDDLCKAIVINKRHLIGLN